MASARRRRSTEEVRALIVEAAEDLFGARGYAQTTMRDIAAEAGIGLSVLYRQFPSKGRLFSATLVAPFAESFRHFGSDQRIADERGLNDEQVLMEFITDLHSNLSAHRRTIIMMLAALEDPDVEIVDAVREALGEAWRQLQLAAPNPAGSALTGNTARDTNILIVGMVASLVVFQPFIRSVRDGDDDQPLDLAAAFCAGGMRSTESAAARSSLNESAA